MDSPSRPTPSLRKDWIIPLCLAPPAIAFRLVAIGQESFWNDEVLSLQAILDGVIHHITTREGSPPLFFYLLKGWSFVFGQSQVALRGFSALMGGLSVPALYFCARRWRFGFGASLVAALILMFNPMAYWFSQMNRYNALFTLLVILWTSTFPALLRPPRGRTAVLGYAFLGFACFATHYYFVFAVFGCVVGFSVWWSIASRDRAILLRFFWSNLVLLGLMLLLLPLVFRQMGHNPLNWLAPPDV